ncbi:MAG: peptidyl-prolyl cis-trans isomerase [bacterium]
MKKKLLFPICCVFIFTSLSVAAKSKKHINKQKQETIQPDTSSQKKNTILEQETSATKADRWVINKILVSINGINIIQSTLEQPQIAKDGQKFTLEEAIQEELLFQKAMEKNPLSKEQIEQDVQRQIVALKTQSNKGKMSDEEFDKELKESGYTLPMYKKQLARLIAVENIKKLEIDEGVFVSSQEVEAYYNNNPEYQEEAFHLKKAVLTEEKKDSYQKLIKEKKITWDDLDWVEKRNIDTQFSLLFTMNKGDISTPVKIDDNKYIIFNIVNKKERKLKELTNRYTSIEKHLRDQKRDSVLSKLLEDLEKKASIVYL